MLGALVQFAEEVEQGSLVGYLKDDCDCSGVRRAGLTGGVAAHGQRGPNGEIGAQDDVVAWCGWCRSRNAMRVNRWRSCCQHRPLNDRVNSRACYDTGMSSPNWIVEGPLVYALGEDGTNRIWAHVHVDRREATEEEEEACAAARTFAASGELLAALEELCVAVEGITNGDLVTRRARAAIRAAREKP